MKNSLIPSKSLDAVYLINKKQRISYWFYGSIIIFLLLMLLPWTQNIRAKGSVTTLGQEQRPQKINSPIPGKISKWFVKEGDFVKKGDTILTLTEIKENYLDPNLIGRTQNQVDAKKGSIGFYEGKIRAAENQISNLENARILKIKQLDNKFSQLENKILADKAELIAINNELELVKNQYERQQKMYDEGLVSQTKLQERNIKYQNVLSKKTVLENKLAQSQQELTNIRIEQNSVEQEYAEKINKTEGDKFQSLSTISSTEADVAKLENQVSNYTIRNGMYIITAPQDGQIVQANKSGLGEILKDGEAIATIVPKRMDYAVEMYIKPMDLPLVEVGQNVRIVFDGFPAIVFSGWPKNSYGTFSGKVVALENTISENGNYRILVAENGTEKQWPSLLKLGTGAHGILLLNDVPIWYEVWRNINGFPADFYKSKESKEPKKAK